MFLLQFYKLQYKTKKIPETKTENKDENQRNILVNLLVLDFRDVVHIC